MGQLEFVVIAKGPDMSPIAAPAGFLESLAISEDVATALQSDSSCTWPFARC